MTVTKTIVVCLSGKLPQIVLTESTSDFFVLMRHSFNPKFQLKGVLKVFDS